MKKNCGRFQSLLAKGSRHFIAPQKFFHFIWQTTLDKIEVI
jgi:hypothetical protein